MSDSEDHDHPPRSGRSGGGGMAALWERVDNHSSMIRSLAEETASQFRDFRAETAQQIGNVATQVDKVATKLDVSATRLADAQRPQYLGIVSAMIGAIGLSVTIIAGLSVLHDRPVDDKLTTLSTQIGDLTKGTTQAFQDAAKSGVSQAEYRLTNDYMNRISDLKTTSATERATRMQSQLDKLQQDIVPRAEHQFHWDGQGKDIDRLQTEITALQNRMDTLTPAGETIKTLRDREHELELRVYGVKPQG